MNNNSVKESKVRLKSFDVLKFFAIFLVLWGHSIQYFLTSNFYDEPVYRIIYSFHMPLFIMISGYFSLSSMSQPLFAFVKKKFIQLLLPCFSWIVVLGLVEFLSRTHFLTQSPALLFIHMKGMLFYIFWSFVGKFPFWFLKTCFFCYLLAYLGSHLKMNKYLWMSLTVILSQFFPFYYSFDIMYPCFLVGMELRANSKFYIQICRHYFWLFVMFFLMLCFWDQFFWGFDGILRTLIVGYLHIDSYSFITMVSKFYKIIIGLFGSLAFVGLICSLITQERKGWLISLCSNWGQYTLGIYILQAIILETYLAKHILLDDFNFFVFNFLLAPILSFLVMAICVYIIKLMSMSAKMAFFFYGKS